MSRDFQNDILAGPRGQNIAQRLSWSMSWFSACCREDREQKMRSSRRLYSLLNSSIRRGTDFNRSALSGQQVWRTATSCCFQSHKVRSRRWVHSSGPWPNTQPHVLNGDGGAMDLYQLTTVEDLKAWFETRKKEIYGTWTGRTHKLCFY